MPGAATGKDQCTNQFAKQRYRVRVLFTNHRQVQQVNCVLCEIHPGGYSERNPDQRSSLCSSACYR